MKAPSRWQTFVAVVLLASPLTVYAELDKSGDIDAYLQDSIAEKRIPGLVAVVTDGNGIIYQAAFGYRDVSDSAPMTVDSIFNIASMTKPVTSVAVMMLIERGKLALDDPVGKYLPDLAHLEVITSHDPEHGTYESKPAHTELTIRHLLTNTSGLGYTFCSEVLAAINPDNKPSIEFPLLHEPGERWTYGQSTRVLGTLVEAISGQSLDTFLEENIFSPLGMADTRYRVATAERERVVTRYQKSADGMAPISYGETIGGEPRGDGGLYSTASDYVAFIRMFLNSGRGPNGERLLTGASIESMGQNHIGDVRVSLQPTTSPDRSQPFPVGAGIDTFGLGFQITAAHDDPERRSPGSMSWAGIYNTEFWIDPERGIGAVLLMQYLPFYDEAAIEVLRGFEQRVYRAINDSGSE